MINETCPAARVIDKSTLIYKGAGQFFSDADFPVDWLHEYFTPASID
jgi:hypothetical protein